MMVEKFYCLFTFVLTVLPLVVVCLPALSSSTIANAKTRLKCEEGKTFDEYTESCCQLCPQGFGVGLPCIQSNDTVCEQCIDGKSYSASQSHVDFCQPCSMCPLNSEIEYKCNVTHNTKCRCSSGYYYDDEQKMCKVCDRCSPGEKAEPACSPYHNTICKPCPTGQFSSESGSSNFCKPCSSCPYGQSVKAECSSYQDTVCETGQSLDDSDKVTFDTGFNLNTLFCIPLAAICIGLVVYVVNKRWKFCTSPPTKTTTSSSNSMSGGSALLKSKADQASHNNVKRSGYQETKPMLSNSGDNLLIINLHKDVLYNLGRLLNECDVETAGWKALARCSGFNESRIKVIEAQTVVRKLPAANIFLQDWSQSSKPLTVGSLCENLSKIHRADCIAIIRSSISNCKNDIYPTSQLI